MKKKHSVFMVFLIVITVILGWKSLEKPRQMAFLKKHEEEMTAFIKKYSFEDEDITFHWDTAGVYNGMAFEAPFLILRFDIINSPDPKYNKNKYALRIDADLKKLNKIDKLMVLNDPIATNIEEDEMNTTKNQSSS